MLFEIVILGSVNTNGFLGVIMGWAAGGLYMGFLTAGERHMEMLYDAFCLLTPSMKPIQGDTS